MFRSEDCPASLFAIPEIRLVCAPGLIGPCGYWLYTSPDIRTIVQKAENPISNTQLRQPKLKGSGHRRRTADSTLNRERSFLVAGRSATSASPGWLLAMHNRESGNDRNRSDGVGGRVRGRHRAHWLVKAGARATGLSRCCSPPLQAHFVELNLERVDRTLGFGLITSS
jgi:hypothetical protein